MTAYYNEFKPEAAHMLRQLIKDGLIAPGDVDDRSITEVKADDLRGYTQCHFFAGIGGWSVALRRAMWSDERPVWTGSCPCQPFSTAGKQAGTSDERDLWPTWFNLIRQCSPSSIYGEQVSSAISHGWLDRVYVDLEAEGYAIGSAVLPACSVDAPHKRDRLWFVAHSKEYDDRRIAGEIQSQNERQTSEGQERGNGAFSNASGDMVAHPQSEQNRRVCQPDTQPNAGTSSSMADSNSQGLQGQRGFVGEYDAQGRQEQAGHDTATGFWHDHDWITCGDNKIRRIPSTQSGICIVANGLQHRAPLLHAFGNAIVPEVAARFIQATM